MENNRGYFYFCMSVAAHCMWTHTKMEVGKLSCSQHAQLDKQIDGISNYPSSFRDEGQKRP